VSRALAVVLLLLTAGCVPGEVVNSDVEPVPRDALAAAARSAAEADSLDPFAPLLEVHPDSVALQRAVQDHLRARLEPEVVREQYRVAVEASPDSALAHYLYGRTLVDEPNLAAGAFARAMELDPLNPWPVVGTAYLRASRGDLYGTIQVYEQALKKAPNSAMLRLFLGNQFLELKLYVKAERELRHAMRLAPDDPEVWAALGKTLALLSHHEPAMELLLRARAADPSIAHMYPTLASMYLTLRDPAAADEAYRAGLEYGLPADRGLAAQIRAAKLVAGIE